MTDTAVLEPAARAAAVALAAESSLVVTPEDFTVTWVEGAEVPSGALFVASVPRAPVGNFVAPGLAVEGEEAIVYPQMALTRAFELWLAADGALRHPADVARAATVLYGGGVRAVIALDDESLEMVREGVTDEAAARLVEVPKAIEVDGRPGVELWWLMATGVSRVRFYLDDRGMVTTSQDRPEDVAGPA